jgi:ATP-dependent Clp protease ATP-binding subunit ClpC
MTSNVGARLITDKRQLGFTSKQDQEDEKKKYEETKKEVMTELKKDFKPEFLNRIDDIIVFHKLNSSDIRNIVELMLKNVVKLMDKQGIKVDIDENAKDVVAKAGTDEAYGARPLKRAIQSLVEDKIAEAILDGKVKDKAKVTTNGEEIEIK